MNTTWLTRVALSLLALLLAQSFCHAEVLINTDFSKGDFQTLGWNAQGAWDIFTYGVDKNDPGPVARFPARQPDGTLTKTFTELTNPKQLALSLDVGWGWGAADHSEGLSFMLLDNSGNGYIFGTHRAKAKWAVQWATVSRNKSPKDRSWASEVVDTTHASVRDGGGMESLTLTRDVDGNWTFTGKGWNKGAGATIKFTDTTTTCFTKLVLVGSQNSDELAFNKIMLDATQGSRYPQNKVSVTAPAYASDVKGDTPINIAAPGFKTVTVKCWKQGAGVGADSTITTLTLDPAGDGLSSFVFPADAYPHGPLTVRISGENGKTKDNCYLQLYNKGGISWNEGLPKDPPSAAKDLKLVFADDFNGPLSISGTDPKATYYDHKPPHGSQDFSSLPFTSFDKPNNPFSQVDSYLRIRASEKAHSSGLISSLKNDGTGIKVSIPCYFECRFLAPNAIGTWPAFWLMTDYMTDYKLKGDKTGCDELDIIEGYGGEGPKAPNAGDKYQIASHYWNQGEAGKTQKGVFSQFSMHKVGIPSTLFETFHIYGCKITATETIYYCDNIEMARHPTGAISKQFPFFFMINLATGGGWPVNLSRYDGIADMYVDYVRVYGEAKP